MSQLSRIQTRIRALIDDLSQTHEGDSFTVATAGASITLTLSESNVNSITSVTLNGSAVSSSDYSLSGNVLTITTTLAVDDAIVVKYTYYAMYSDTELKSYMEAALTYISVADIDNVTIDEAADDEFAPILSEKQENLVALVTAIVIKPLYSSYRTATMSVTYPETKSKEEKIRRVLYDYKHNIGIFAVC